MELRSVDCCHASVATQLAQTCENCRALLPSKGSILYLTILDYPNKQRFKQFILMISQEKFNSHKFTNKTRLV